MEQKKCGRRPFGDKIVSDEKFKMLVDEALELFDIFITDFKLKHHSYVAIKEAIRTVVNIYKAEFFDSCHGLDIYMYEDLIWAKLESRIEDEVMYRLDQENNVSQEDIAKQERKAQTIASDKFTEQLNADPTLVNDPERYLEAAKTLLNEAREEVKDAGKKPESVVDDGCDWVYWICPQCHLTHFDPRAVAEKMRSNYCYNCGQRIEWKGAL